MSGSVWVCRKHEWVKGDGACVPCVQSKARAKGKKTILAWLRDSRTPIYNKDGGAIPGWARIEVAEALESWDDSSVSLPPKK